MDHIHSNTIEDVRTPGRHLSLEERGMIQALHRQGFPFTQTSLLRYACAHTTVFYELRRGTPDRKSKHGPLPSACNKRGQKAYAESQELQEALKIDHDDCELFIQWMVERVRQERWSLDYLR